MREHCQIIRIPTGKAISWVPSSSLSLKGEIEIGMDSLGFPGKEPICQGRRQNRGKFNPLGQKDPLEKGTATHSSILAWRIPWTEEAGRLNP